MTTGNRHPGEFCWSDIMTRDLDKTKTLFAKLFGWSYSEELIPGGSLLLAKSGSSIVGALHDLKGDPRGQGVPPHWGVHVMTKNADATAKLVTANGGKLMCQPMDIMENGRMVAFTDPTGAQMCCWEPKRKPGMNADSIKHGAPSWIELRTTDVDRCGAFYAKVFGWIPSVQDMGGGMKYTMFKLGANGVAGMFGIPPHMGPVSPHWACFVTVDRIDQTAKDCAALGGKVRLGPQDIPGVGRFACMETAEGMPFYAITWLPKAGT